MLIVYNESDNSIVSISGTRPHNGRLSQPELRPELAGGISTGRVALYVEDIPTIESVLDNITAGAKVELDNDLNIVLYDIVQASAPATASIDQTVTVTGAIPIGSPDTTIDFQVEGGAVYTEPVTSGSATHNYAFAAGTYKINVSSAHHGKNSAEVVVS